jgi:SEC-C motif
LAAFIQSATQWHVIPSAALARSLLEGALGFLAEADAIATAWAEMKRQGAPELLEAKRAAAEVATRVAEAQWGTQVAPEAPLRRPRVMTLMERGAEVAGLNLDSIKEHYRWLSDAVHPSFASQTVFTAELLQHTSGMQAVTVLRRHLPNIPPDHDYEPLVALAAVDAATVALEELARGLPAFQAVADDYGLTTGACFASRLEYWRCFKRPERNDMCPCGSGRKYKSCIHDWGQPAPRVGDW